MGKLDYKHRKYIPLGVSVTEVLIEIVKKRIKERHQHAFEQFFGVDIHHDPGSIVLQADRMDELLKPCLRPLPDPLKNTRLFKARRWINAHDVEGARAIREAFWKVGSRPPELLLESEGRNYTYGTRPCVICMGLGFTSETQRILGKAGKGWMKAPPSTTKGDAIALHRKVFPFDLNEVFETGKPADADGFIELHPKDWDSDKYPGVRDEPDDKTTESQRDYAMILRYTEMVDQSGPGQAAIPRTWFVLAGFTAHATAAAGMYLARNWHDIWKRYVKDEPSSLGDFCQIIAGQSEHFNKAEKPDAWEMVGHRRLTPKGLQEAGLSCEWTKRLEEHRREDKGVRQLLRELSVAMRAKFTRRTV